MVSTYTSNGKVVTVRQTLIWERDGVIHGDPRSHEKGPVGAPTHDDTTVAIAFCPSPPPQRVPAPESTLERSCRAHLQQGLSRAPVKDSRPRPWPSSGSDLVASPHGPGSLLTWSGDLYGMLLSLDFYNSQFSPVTPSLLYLKDSFFILQINYFLLIRIVQNKLPCLTLHHTVFQIYY